MVVLSSHLNPKFRHSLDAAIHMRPERGRKYGNRKVRMDGFTFDSVKESKRFVELRLMERAGKIKDLQVHPNFDIMVNGQKVCVYRGDFSYLVPARKVVPDGELVSYVREKDMLFERIVEDCKGRDRRTGWTSKTSVYELKKRLMRIVLGIAIREV